MIKLKTKIRAIGIDDGPFKFCDDNVLVVGSLVRSSNYLEGVLSTRVDVDGFDSTDKVIEMLGGRLGEQARVLFLDGIALGGFNIIDINRLNDEINIPVVSVSREKPDIKSIKNAMKKHVDNWREKFELTKRYSIHKIETKDRPIYIHKKGLELKMAKHYIRLFTVRGRLPEPIRISHMIASGINRGESKGKP